MFQSWLSLRTDMENFGFKFGVFLFGFNLGGLISGTYEGHAAALASLDVANGDIDIGAGSQAFIDAMSSGGNTIATVGAYLFYFSAICFDVFPKIYDSCYGYRYDIVSSFGS